MRCTARAWSACDFGLASAYSCSMVFMRARIAGLKNPAMRDDALVRFTAHEIPREDLHALMARSDGPALRRAVWHLGMLVLTGTALWRLRLTVWALPLVLVQGYMLAFVFCALHETAHRTAFRTRWLNPVLGTVAGLLGFWPYRNYRVYHWEHHRSRKTWSGIPSSTSRSPPPCPC